MLLVGVALKPCKASASLKATPKSAIWWPTPWRPDLLCHVLLGLRQAALDENRAVRSAELRSTPISAWRRTAFSFSQLLPTRLINSLARMRYPVLADEVAAAHSPRRPATGAVSAFKALTEVLCEPPHRLAKGVRPDGC